MTLYTSRRVTTLGVLVLSLSIAASVSAGFFKITPPRKRLPTDQTYGEAAASWWTWALSQPATKNPLKDPTGKYCAEGQPASDIWYLAGSNSPEPVVRRCTVPRSRTLLFPVLNVISSWIPDSPTDIATEEDVESLRANARVISDATDLSLTIDGVKVHNLKRFYEESELIKVDLPADNIFGVPEGKRIDPGADAGYYVAVSGLHPGKHTLVWSGRSEALDFSQDITYVITVR
jgi:hypothetical protein